MAIDHFPDLLPQIGAAGDAIDEIRPVERADEDFRLRQLQLAGDVVPDALGRGRRVGMHADLRKRLLERLEHAILGPEIVSPVADAVGLVDGEERQRRLLEEFQRPLGHQRLGREIQQLQAAATGFRSATRRFSSSESVLLTAAAATPLSTRASTWSFINEMSGETTTASPSIAKAGA